MALGIWLVVALTQKGYCYERVFFKMMDDHHHLPYCVMCAAIDVEGTQQEANKRQTHEDRTCEYIQS